jgi:hypothetical protein
MPLGTKLTPEQHVELMTKIREQTRGTEGIDRVIHHLRGGGDCNHIAETLTRLSLRLCETTTLYGQTPKLTYYPAHQPTRPWTAAIQVKPAGRRDRTAFAMGADPEDALLRLLQGLSHMVAGHQPACGGNVEGMTV